LNAHKSFAVEQKTHSKTETVHLIVLAQL